MAWTPLDDLIPTSIGAVVLICSQVDGINSMKCHVVVKDQYNEAIRYVRDNLVDVVTPGRIAQVEGVLDDVRQKAEAELIG